MRVAASSEDRTRDLALTKRMLCQLSYRGVLPVTATAGPAKKKFFLQSWQKKFPVRDSNPGRVGENHIS